MVEILKEPYMALFLIMIFGVALSKITVKGINLGSSSVVIAALFFGHFGFSVPNDIEKIGLILFIFSVGIQAGPGFFESFRTGEARQYLTPVFLILTLILGLNFFIPYLWWGVSGAFSAGIFSGVTTSTASLVAITENSQSSLPILGYTIAYPISLITTIISIRIIIRLLKIDVKKEEEAYFKETEKVHPKIFSQIYRVENPSILGKTIKEIHPYSMTNSLITRIRKKEAEKSLIPTQETILEQGDLIKAVGSHEALEKMSLLIGPRSKSSMKLSREEDVISVMVTDIRVIGKRLKNLNLTKLWGAEITKITRSGINLIPRGNTRLRFGDKVLMTVKKETAPTVIKILGGLESKEIDFLPMALSIVLGVLIGQIKFEFAGTLIGPGISGGILFATLTLGRIGKTGPLLWSIAGTTNQFLRQLGLMFFLCGVGVKTGGHLLEALSASQGLKIAYFSALTTSFSIFITSFIVIKVQNMNKLRLIGALAGSLTCASALPSPKEINNSTIPLTAYSITYPFALLSTIFLGQIFLLFS